MLFLKAVILGIIQGVTEFLPVSSSGHLVLARDLLGVKSPGAKALWEVTLHLGTLVAVLVVFRRDVWALIAGFLRGLAAWLRGGRKAAVQVEGFSPACWIIVGTVPAGLVGVCCKDFVEGLTDRPLPAAVALLVTGVVLYLTRFARPPREDGRVGWVDAIWIGVAQAIAIMPGISRSGATISTGLFRGVDRTESARFSFLLSIPAIAGAGLLEGRHIAGLRFADLAPLLAGGVAAAVVGVAALILLMRVVKTGRLYLFAYWCWAVGLIGLAGLLSAR